MILTKNKILFKENKKTSIKKPTLFKKSLISGAILFTALFSWEASVTLTNSINISNRIDASVANLSGLNNYEKFKSRINNTPYTNKEFQRDLKLFGYMFENNDTPLMKLQYGDYELFNFMVDRAILKNENIDEIFKTRISESNKFKNDKIDYKAYYNEKYSNFFNPNHFINSEEQLLNKSSALFRFNGESSIGEVVLIDGKIYENMRQLIKEKGFSEDLLYMSRDNYKNYNKEISILKADKKSNNNYEKALNKINYDFKKRRIDSLDKMKEYYKNGDYEKLRELFKALNGFSVTVFDSIVDKNKIDTYGIRPSNLLDEVLKNMGLLNNDDYNGYSKDFKKYYMDDAKRVAKLKGTYNEESKKYYDGKSFLLLNL